MKIFERCLFGKLVGTLLSGLLACAGANAGERSDLRWHGFLNQGVIHTDENNLFGDSADTSFDFRDVGVGFSWQAHNRLLISAQAIYRDAGGTSPNGINVDYALLNYSLINRMDFGLGVRAGRVKNPYGLYNETRDVAATKPSILLPMSIYPTAFRDIFHTSDSVVLYGYKELGNWLVNFDLLRGEVPFDKKSERLLIPSPQQASIVDDELWAARSIVEFDGGRMRLGATYVKFDGRIDTVGGPGRLNPGVMDIDSHIFSFEYNWECYQFTSEYLRTNYIYRGVFAPGLISKRVSDGYYVQLGWQITEKLRAFGRYDNYYSDRNDKSGAGQALLGRPNSDAFIKSLAVGAQYYFSRSLMLAGEIHHINGTTALPVIENPDASRVKEDWNLYTLQLSYKF